MTASISSKYKDFISRSIQIHSGPPAVYQLKPNKEKTDTVSRVTVGKKNVSKPNRTILLVGETGAGKSALINTLLNYSMGVKWEDGVWFQIVEEERKSQTQSQTSDVIVYEIFDFEDETLPFSLTIIDTPGFRHSKGTDDINKRLLNLFGSDDGVHEVHTVGLVMKASENRLTEQLMYVSYSVMSLFGRNMEKNIIALITHSDGKTPENVLEALEAINIKCAKNEKNEPVQFLFDNCQDENRTEENESVLEAAWRVSERELNKFTAFLETSEPQNIMKTLKVLNERVTLTDCINNLKEKIKVTEQKQTEIRQIQEALKKNEEEIKNNEKFTVEVDEVYKEKTQINEGMWWLVRGYEGAVCCTVCEETCHYPGCTWTNSPKYCEVMKAGRCIVCTGKCPASVHVKEKWRYVTKTRKVQKTVEKIKEKFEKNKSERENKLILLENMKREMNQLRAEQKQFLDQSYQHVLRLEQIALKADSATTIVHLDLLIEKMKEEGDTEKVQKLEDIKSREDEGTREALRDMFD